MTDGTLRRADQLISELVELVETARAVPMSASCVVPREHLLDMLDDLREVMPPEMIEARRVLVQRDSMLSAAHDAGEQAKAAAAAHTAQVRAEAQEYAADLVNSAQIRAREIIEAAELEHKQLVSASGVHQSAAQAAAKLGTEALHYAESTRAEADAYAHSVRAEAEGYAAALRADSQAYADKILADLGAVLQRAQTTAQQGRAALARRSGPTPSDDEPDDSVRPGL